jgi:hypothetical protein
MNRHLILPLIALVFCAILANAGHALTIYRIGGSDLPPPERDAPFNFVQLEWAAIDAKQHGSTLLTEIGAALEPQQLDPTVNLTPLLDGRGGKIETLRSIVGWADFPARDAPMFDGDPDTHFLGDGDWGGDYGAIENKVLVFDLGGLFNVDRIRFYPREKHLVDRFIETFVVGTNDGDPLKDGTREYRVGEGWVRRPPGAKKDFEVAYRITENTRSDIDLEMPDRPIRNILFEASANVRGAWEIAEFEIYGFGFAPQATYVSNVIDLGQAVSLGRLDWSAEAATGASIELIMRSGDDSDPNTYWRKTFRGDETTRYGGDGKALILSTYNKLDKGERAGITPDTENWQPWSPPYDLASGSGDLEGNKPRQFVQFTADFVSTAEAGGQLHYLQFEVSDPPVATQALGEIVPVRVSAGEVTLFTCKILSRLTGTDLGFDSIEIETTARISSVDQVRLEGVPVNFTQVPVGENGFELRIPRMDLQRTNELLEVDFQAEVFQFGTVFSARIFDSEQPHEVHQEVTAGDADQLVDSNTLSVGLIDIDRKAINALRLPSRAFTPNGDGANDRLRIQYELLNLGAVPVAIDLYDLAGRRIGEVYRGTASSGRFEVSWDGRDARANLLPPGLYILRLEVDSDGGVEAEERVVSLVY